MFRWIVIAAATTPMSLAFIAFSFAQQQPTVDLTGVIDFHCHVAPDAAQARPLTEFDLTRMARRSGMRGIVIKSHYLPTFDRAQVVMQELGDDVQVFGGVALNRSNGGINPEMVLKMTQTEGRRGKVVWLPTFDSEHQKKSDNSNAPFVSVVKDGKPVPELAEIFKLIAQNDLVLATGHSSPEESLIIAATAKQAGVRKILVTHAMSDPVRCTEEQMKKFADMGVIMECVWLVALTPQGGTTRRLVTSEDYSRVMKLIGPEHFIISSDLGQQLNPVHPDGMIAFMRGLKGQGLTDEQIDRMAKINPARLLGLEAW